MSDLRDLSSFRPRIGSRQKPRSGGGGASFRNAVLAGARLFGSRKGKAASGPRPRSRIAVLSPGASARRVAVKAHYVKLNASGAKAARLHLRYIERDGVEPDGSKGILYGADGLVQRQTFEEPRLGEAHQFRLVVSPEDGHELDMTAYIRSFMMRVEKDLGRRLEWAAVNHFDTDHPHAHIVIRGVDRDGHELRLERSYISNGLRWRAQELATHELGPRKERDIERARGREVTQERFTSLDRVLERRAEGDRVEMKALLGRERPFLLARLEQLEAMGLAERTAAASWTFSTGWQHRLRDLGSRGDVVKQMHAAMAGDPARYHVVRPGQSLSSDGQASEQVTGRIAGKGLSDELKGAFYVVVETPDGRGYHVPIDAGSADRIRVGDVVSLATRPEAPVRPVDHHIVERADACGVYVPDRPPGTDTPAAERRLCELERVGLVKRQGAEAWQVPPDLVARIEQHPALGRDRHRLFIQKESLDLAAQVRHQGPIWLDRLRAPELAPYCFGAELRRMLERRQEALRGFGIRPDDPDRIEKLGAVEARAVGKRIAERSGQRFVDVPPPGFRGRVQVLDAEQGATTHAVVSDGFRFVLVRMGPSVRALDGKTVTVSRDPKGRVMVRRAHERDRGS